MKKFPISNFQFLILIIFLLTFNLERTYAQNNSFCGTQINTNNNLNGVVTPCDFSSPVSDSKEVDIVYIPVVFHVVASSEESEENISPETIQSAINKLNLDFRRIDTGDGPIQIEFILAKIDPDGNCSEGITRNFDPNLTTNVPNPGPFTTEVQALKSLVVWDQSKYINIWVVHDIDGFGGFSSFPFVGLPGNQGVVSEFDQLEVNLAHEIGHFLGLFHVHGCGGGCGDICGMNDSTAMLLNDYVPDTPPAFDPFPVSGGAECDSIISLTCNSPVVLPNNDPEACIGVFSEMFYPTENIMSIFLNCIEYFTSDQFSRMFYFLNNDYRDLWYPGYIIKSEMIVDKPTNFHRDVEIFAGGKLIIESEAIMAEGTNIIVHQGGQLEVNGGHLRGCDVSDTERGKWNGIVMRGRNQEGFDVELKNFSVVEDVDGFAVSTEVNIGPSFQFNDNGRLRAVDTEFNNVDGLADLRNVFAGPNNSQIEGCIQNGGEVGISNIGCWDVDVVNNQFFEIEKECIKATNGSFVITGNDFYANENDIALTYLLATVRSVIRNNNFFGSRGGIRLVGETNFPNLIEQNAFIETSEPTLSDIDVYADGAAHYSISNNTFSGVFGAVSRANGESENQVLDNQFIQNLVGIYPHDDNPNYTFYRNCFSCHIVDASIFGSVADQEPSDGTHANNCFTHQGGLLNFPFYQNDIGGEPNQFVYFEPDDNKQDCRDAYLSHPNVDRDLEFEDIGKVCGQFFINGEEPGNVQDNSEYEDFLRAKNYDGLEIISQSQSIAEGTILSFTTEIMQGNYVEARSKLNFNTSPNPSGLSDLSFVLNRYVDLLESPENVDILVQENKQQLENIALKAHPYSAYAQALYFLMTDVFVDNLDVSIVESYNVTERSSILAENKSESFSDLLYPNPAQKVVNVSDPQTIVSITVYSSVGQMIYHTDEVQDVLDIRGWQNGLYFFDVEMQDRSKEIVKLVKNN